MESDDGSWLCYHCKALKTGRSCFKYEAPPAPADSREERNPGFLRSLREPLYSGFVKAMALKTLASTAISDFLDYLRYRKVDPNLDPLGQSNSQFQYANFPEHIHRCDRCLCYFSAAVPCHCGACAEGAEPHYAILMHGILTSPLMMTDLCKALFERYPGLFVYFPVCVCGKTLHGTSCVLKFLVEELQMLFAKLPGQFKLSLLGHSFGGVLVRYFAFHHLKTAGRAPPGESARRRPPDRRITWKNLVCIATPHAGIYENNQEFRKLVSLIGSETVNELENETLDLLFLLKDGGLLEAFESVAIYGNISGDMMVAPRTSIILPNHIYSDHKLAKIHHVLQKIPGKPTEMSRIFDHIVLDSGSSDFGDETSHLDVSDLSEPESGEPAHSGDSPHSPLDRARVVAELTARFAEMVERKTKRSKNLRYMQELVMGEAGEARHSPPQKRLRRAQVRLFGEADLARFNAVIAEIVNNSDAELLGRLQRDEGLFYFEVLLSLMHRVRSSRFAVYIPRINMPHRSIISFQSPVTQESYTGEILGHISRTFLI